MKKYKNALLVLSIVFYALALLSLVFAFVSASDPVEYYTHNGPHFRYYGFSYSFSFPHHGGLDFTGVVATATYLILGSVFLTGLLILSAISKKDEQRGKVERIKEKKKEKVEDVDPDNVG